MKFTKLSLIFSIFISLICAFSAFAQTETFSDPNVDYTFEIPDATWKMTAKPSNISPNVEYVYGTRQDGHLEVRKLSIKSGEKIDDIVRDEESKLQFKPGFVAGKEENFKGFMAGKVYNFEFVKSGRNWSGRYYFLKADDDTIYVLRFEGYNDKLRSLRNIIDSMARTFNVAKGK
jgi:hypothetical protein